MIRPTTKQWVPNNIIVRLQWGRSGQATRRIEWSFESKPIATNESDSHPWMRRKNDWCLRQAINRKAIHESRKKPLNRKHQSQDSWKMLSWRRKQDMAIACTANSDWLHNIGPSGDSIPYRESKEHLGQETVKKSTRKILYYEWPPKLKSTFQFSRKANQENFRLGQNLAGSRASPMKIRFTKFEGCT